MIQDIFPKHLNNHYVDCQPGPEDSVICIQGRHTWLLPDNSYPACRHFAGLEGVEYRYLFSIDGERFFLALTEEDLTPLGLENHSTRIFRHLEPMDRAYAGFTAQHLAGWYQANRFCGCCGKPMIPGTDERKMVCPGCGNVVYPRINPAILAAVTDGDRLLMTRYAAGPVQRFVLIAGFTEIGETAEEAVAREVMEEVGVKVKNIRYYGSQPWGCSGNLTLGYFCELDGSDQLTVDHSELSTGRWFRREEIPVPEDTTSLTSEMVRRFARGEI